jgi:methylated-DNA-protein-cysteine methyltransferase-like protein
MNNRDDIYTAIYEIVRMVPRGRVTTYGAVAAAVGLASGARMVGYAMKHAGAVKPKVPAHRVLNSSGLLTGKHAFGSPTRMQELLEKEGVHVVDDKVVDFPRLFWDPLREIET